MISRRTFLSGLGAGLALPLLPSLRRDARAEPRGGPDPYARVLFVVWSHGIYHPLWLPTFTTTERQVAPGVRAQSMRDASFGSYMGSHFDGLRDKITMLRGVSQLGAWGHSPSVALAASERVNDAKIDSIFKDSIDNVIAGSRSFYASPPPLDVLRLSTGGLKHGHSYRGGRSLDTLSSSAAYAKLFGSMNSSSDPNEAARAAASRAATRQGGAVERALGRYRALLESGRLSSADRAILEQTMTHYAELSENMRRRAEGAGSELTSACDPSAISGRDEIEDKVADQIKLIVQGFACGATRVGYWRLRSTHADADGAHKADSSSNVAGTGRYTQYMKKNMEWTARLLTTMDAIREGNGRSMLENSLVVVTSDMATSAIGSHPGVDAPFLLAGGLGGAIRMGEYFDYADQSLQGALRLYNGKLSKPDVKKVRMMGGPPHHELWIAILNALGVPPSDWSPGATSTSGFGHYDCTGNKLCTKMEYEPQSAYVRYFHDHYKNTRPLSSELAHLRVQT